MAIINGPQQGGQFIPGTSGDDTINAYGDNNSLYGAEGTNFLNILNGGSHNSLVGGPGIDHLDGGTGIDNLASYQLSAGPVTASLANPGINTGDAAGDTYVNIYGLTGTTHGSTLYGDNTGHDNQLWSLGGTSYLYGGTGYATLINGPGDDHMVGGSGRGLIDYETAAAGVTASLANPSINTGEAAGDTYTNLQDMAGGAFNDVLYGDANNNNMLGLAGNDTMFGGAGVDTLTGGKGADVLSGGANVDLFVFGPDDLNDAQSGIYDRVADYDQGNKGSYDSTEFDGISLSLLHTSAGSVRVLEDASGTFATLQLNSNGTWLQFIKLDGLHSGDSVRVIFDDSQPSGTVFTSQGGAQSGTPGIPSYDIGSHGSNWPVSGIGDFNGDGTSDVLWRSPGTSQVDQWQMSNGHWAKSIDMGATKGADWQLAGTGDFNGDHTSDVLWTNTATGQVDQWQMQGGYWSKSIDLGSSHGAGWQVAGVGDFNGDGTSDVLWRNASTGQVDEWQMNNGLWAKSVDLGSAHGSGWQVTGVGDFNGDGTSDVLWRNASTGQVDEWQMQGGQWAKSVDLGASKGSDWTYAGAVDFNHDGTADIAWMNVKSGQVEHWQMQNGLWAASVSDGVQNTAVQPAGVGDFNHDGSAEVLFYNPTTAHLYDWAV